MARTLDVYLHHDLVGCLIQDDHGEMVFDYDQRWLVSSVAVPLSHSLPLRSERYSRRECRAFFGGILPEAEKRDKIAHNLGISSGNDFAMLELIGGECAGAVTFLPSGQDHSERNPRYRPLTESELADILRQLPRRPLMAGENGVRLSLAGAQDKIAVQIANGQISIPLDGSPSTHIIKPAIDRFEGVVFNEALCMALAKTVGLPTAELAMGKVENIDYLIVERYDRVIGLDIQRLHQEDFCEALGIAADHKYQNEGGPSIAQCFQLIREVSSIPIIDLSALLDGIIFNFLIGNNDAHGKNFSLVYQGIPPSLTARLAPFYDLLSTVFYPELSDKMAMKLGGEYVSERVVIRHFERFAEDASLGKPMVKRRIRELAERTISSLSKIESERKVEIEIAKLIQSRCMRTLQRLGVRT